MEFYERDGVPYVRMVKDKFTTVDRPATPEEIERNTPVTADEPVSAPKKRKENDE